MKRNLEARVELVTPVLDPGLRADLRMVLDTQVGDQRSAWDMRPDGSYTQRVPAGEAEAKGSQQTFLDLYDDRLRDATRLKRRTPRGIAGRNLR